MEFLATILGAAVAADGVVNIKQDFWDFAKHLTDQEVWVSSMSMLAGAFAHWIKKAAAKEASWNLWTYCFRDYPWRSVYLVFGLIGAEITYITSPLPDSATWAQLIVTSFLTGFAVNSTLNKGAPPAKEGGNA